MCDSRSEDTGLCCGSVRLRSHLNHTGHLEAERPHRYSEQERTRQGLVEGRELANQKGEDSKKNSEKCTGITASVHLSACSGFPRMISREQLNLL